MKYFTAVNEVYATFFTSEPPSRTTVAVTEVPVKGGRIIKSEFQDLLR